MGLYVFPDTSLCLANIIASHMMIHTISPLHIRNHLDERGAASFRTVSWAKGT